MEGPLSMVHITHKGTSSSFQELWYLLLVKARGITHICIQRLVITGEKELPSCMVPYVLEMMSAHYSQGGMELHTFS